MYVGNGECSVWFGGVSACIISMEYCILRNMCNQEGGGGGIVGMYEGACIESAF